MKIIIHPVVVLLLSPADVVYASFCSDVKLVIQGKAKFKVKLSTL